MEADFGITSMAMDVGSNRSAGNDQLLVRFYHHPKQDKIASKEEGRPVFRDVVYIEKRAVGSRDVINRPAWQKDYDEFPEHYRKFKARESQEEITGTLLEEWPMITRSQVEELRFFGVRTVEQLVGMADVHAQGMMGINVLKEKAKKFLEASEQSQAAEKLRDAENEIAMLKEQMSKLLAAQEEGEEAPKRRGRPPKTE